MAYRTYNGQKLFEYDDSLDRPVQKQTQQVRQAQQTQQSGGLGGLLGSIIGGIGDTIGSIGKGIFGTIGTGVASAKDLLSGGNNGNITYTKSDLKNWYEKNKNNQDWLNQYKPVLDQMAGRDKISGVWLEDSNGKPIFVESKEGKETTAFKRSVYGNADDNKIDYNKTGWDAVKSASDIASLVSPLATAGMGTGTRIATDLALDTGLGAISGAAQTGANGGSLEDIGKGALIGGASGLASSGLGNGLNVAAGKTTNKLLNNRLINSSVGRGALSGTVGGAVGGGTSAALYGQDVGQAALAGAGQGALQGAGAGAVMALGNRAINGIKNKVTGDNRATVAEAPMKDQAEAVLGNDQGTEIPELERPRGWNGEELSIKKKNAFNKAGDALEQTGENIRNRDINNRLYSKTAEGVYERDSINRLRKLGYEPESYGEAAKVSETVNKFTNDIIPEDLKVKTTGIQADLTNFDDIPGAINNSKFEKDINNQIIKRLDTSRSGNSATMDEYSVRDLWKSSKELMDLSTSYRKKGMSVNGDVTNPDYVTAADRLSSAAKKMRATADSEVQWGDSFDKNVLTSRLKNLGASQNDIDYLTQAKDLADLKRRTSVYEDARQMDREIGKSNIRRNAVAGTSTNPVNILTQESGIGEILRTAARPVGKATGAITRKAGRLLNKAGDIAGNIGGTTQAAATKGQRYVSDNILDIIGRTQGIKEGEEVRTQPKNEVANLESQLGNTALSTEGTGYTEPTTMTSYGTGTYANTGYAGTGNNMLDRLVGGMENALNAGDISAFSQLAEIYNTLAKVYGVSSSSSTTGQQKLSATQQRANAAMNSLDRLSGMTPDVGYNLSGIPIIGDIATLGGNAYEGEAKSLAQQIGYMVSGSNIKQEEAEAIGKSYVPQPFDSEYTRQLKLQRAREIISQYQNGVAETPTETYAY